VVEAADTTEHNPDMLEEEEQRRLAGDMQHMDEGMLELEAEVLSHKAAGQGQLRMEPRMETVRHRDMHNLEGDSNMVDIQATADRPVLLVGLDHKLVWRVARVGIVPEDSRELLRDLILEQLPFA